jgi:hypothetical protein
MGPDDALALDDALASDDALVAPPIPPPLALDDALAIVRSPPPAEDDPLVLADPSDGAVPKVLIVQLAIPLSATQAPASRGFERDEAET